MPNFRFIAYGTIVASGVDYAHSDIRAALTSNPRIKHSDHRIIPDHNLCEGSEQSATNVTVSTDIDHPYHMGRCSACGGMVPLLSAGQFEVIKHFAPSNYPAVDGVKV